MSQFVDLTRFYAILDRLKTSTQQGLSLYAYGGGSGLPARGVYFFCEPNEQRSLFLNSPRIVRVGTHAVSAGSKSTLWQRLRAHRGALLGGGNHRGSIFRLHVGAALLVRDRVSIPTWGSGSSAPPALRQSHAAQVTESSWEKRVSEYIGAMTVFWVNAPDEPSSSSIRAVIERNAIALLSNRFAPIDPPSAGWLGLYSPKNDIRRSGLWNLNYLDHVYDPCFLDLFETAVEQTVDAAARSIPVNLKDNHR